MINLYTKYRPFSNWTGNNDWFIQAKSPEIHIKIRFLVKNDCGFTWQFWFIQNESEENKTKILHFPEKMEDFGSQWIRFQ